MSLESGTRASSSVPPARGKSLKTLRVSTMSTPLAIMDLKSAWDGRQDRAVRAYRNECWTCEFFHQNLFAPLTKTPDKLFWCDRMDGEAKRRCKIKDAVTRELAQLKYIPRRQKEKAHGAGPPSNPPGIVDQERSAAGEDVQGQRENHQEDRAHGTSALPHMQTAQSASIRARPHRSRRSQGDGVDLPPLPQN